MLLHLSHFFLPFIPIRPAPPLPPAFPTPLGHIHGSYKILWLLHLLYYSSPLPVFLVPTIYASYSLYLFPHSSRFPSSLITLHLISISVILFLF